MSSYYRHGDPNTRATCLCNISSVVKDLMLMRPRALETFSRFLFEAEAGEKRKVVRSSREVAIVQEKFLCLSAEKEPEKSFIKQ